MKPSRIVKMKNGMGQLFLRTTIGSVCWLAALFLSATAGAVSAEDFNYTTNNGTLTITGYTGSEDLVDIPSSINGMPVIRIGDNAFATNNLGISGITIPSSVTSIGSNAFHSCVSLSDVTIPHGVTNIGAFAFAYCLGLNTVTIPRSVTHVDNSAFSTCSSLTGVYFLGTAPFLGTDVFSGSYNPTVYYLPGTGVWSPTFGGRPAVLWDPHVLQNGNFGAVTNVFGFPIAGANDLIIVVEACTNLANPAWSPIGTNTLTSGTSYFGDAQWTNYPTRFYRFRAP